MVIICTESDSASIIYYISNADVSTTLEVVLQKRELGKKEPENQRSFTLFFVWSWTSGYCEFAPIYRKLFNYT